MPDRSDPASETDKDTAPGWVKPVMRLGYATRGITYVLVGGLVILAAWTGGEAEGTKGALAELRDTPWGRPALVAIAFGFWAYALWRLIDAWKDLEDYGHGAKGVVARGGQLVTGAIHATLGVSTLRMAFGGDEGGNGAESLTSKALQMPNGALIVMAVGAVTVCAGLYYGWKGIAEKYKDHIHGTWLTERLDPAIKAGLVAHGLVIVLVGLFLWFAGQTTDPDQAGGVSKAFATVRAQPFGRILLGMLGFGMLGFAIYCWVEACYRVIPRLAGDDVTTMAARAKAKAKATARSGLRQAGAG